MLALNQSHEITVPGGDPARPVKLLGMQDYSPGQTRKVDEWHVQVPDDLLARWGNHHFFGSYKAACEAIATVFFGGDEAALEANMVSKSKGL